MVQKGKLADWALALDKALKRVDLPTLGRPTIPHWRPIGTGNFLGVAEMSTYLPAGKPCKVTGTVNAHQFPMLTRLEKLRVYK
jgi:hypothetical protein